MAFERGRDNGSFDQFGAEELNIPNFGPDTPVLKSKEGAPPVKKMAGSEAERSTIKEDSFRPIPISTEHKRTHRKKRSKSQGSQIMDALEAGRDPDEEITKELEDEGRLGNEPDDDLSAALSRVTRGTRTRRRKKGRRRAGTGTSQFSRHSVGSSYSLASGQSHADFDNFMGSSTEAENIKARKRLERSVSRISMALSEVEDDEDEDNYEARRAADEVRLAMRGKSKKNKRKRKSDFPSITDDGAEYISIKASDMAAFANAAKAINDDPSNKNAVDIEFINPIAADLRKKAENNKKIRQESFTEEEEEKGKIQQSEE